LFSSDVLFPVVVVVVVDAAAVAVAVAVVVGNVNLLTILRHRSFVKVFQSSQKMSQIFKSQIRQLKECCCCCCCCCCFDGLRMYMGSEPFLEFWLANFFY